MRTQRKSFILNYYIFSEYVCIICRCIPQSFWNILHILLDNTNEIYNCNVLWLQFSLYYIHDHNTKSHNHLVPMMFCYKLVHGYLDKKYSESDIYLKLIHLQIILTRPQQLTIITTPIRAFFQVHQIRCWWYFEKWIFHL